MKVLAFDIWGDYAHFKKIYATTSAVSYLIPTKPAIYGYIGAIIGLQKFSNEYLRHFSNKACLIGLSLRGSVSLETQYSNSEAGSGTIMRRMGVNLRIQLGPRKETDTPKPTLIEYVWRPKYRVYISHQDGELYQKLKEYLVEHRSVYTPTLGLAGLLSNFLFQGEYETEAIQGELAVPIHSIIPKKQFKGFETGLFDGNDRDFSIVEQSMYAIEMDKERNVIERDDVLVERNGNPIPAKVTQYYPVNGKNIILF